jgi:hypothetical protein
MQQWIKDMAGLGTGLWLIGYLASLALYFTPIWEKVGGWILLIIFTPVTIAVAWWWFKQQEPYTLPYYAGDGIAWMLIAIVLDYLFIVRLFQAAYYGTDVFVYYALTFLIPVGVGSYLNRTRSVPVSNKE